MKNIHVIQTDKPSRLAYDFYEKFYLLSEDTQFFEFQNLVQNRELYITSDEEIKEGDWVYRDSGIVFKMTKELLEYYISIKDKDTHKRYKIILTTDQDLIKDGVQAINDNFLEWFVKNPSCEEVEVNFVTKQLIKPYDVYNESVSYYKIIIPKEEQKKHLIDMMQEDEELGLYDIFNDEKRQGVKELIDKHKQEAALKEALLELRKTPMTFEPEQETLEEASWKFNPLKKLDGEFLRNAFKEGAKSDAARDYWFEQFKKK